MDNRVRRLVRLIVASIIMAGLTACAHRPVQVASNTTPVNNREAYAELGEVDAKACDWRVLRVIPVGKGNSWNGNRLHKAVEEAKEQHGADALVDVTVDDYRADYWLVDTRCTKVHGTAVRLRR